MPTNQSKTLVRFNIQNLKYAVANGDSWATPIPYGTSIKMALESDISAKNIYGDGRIIATVVNDKGKTGTVTTNNVSNDYEIAMRRKLPTANGLADIQQHGKVPHCLYFETRGLNEDDTTPTSKTWLYNVTSMRPNETFDQTTDDVNESTFDTPLEIRGLPVKNADGTPYKDNKGNLLFAWQMTVTPEDEGYDTFGDAVVLPVMPPVEA